MIPETQLERDARYAKERADSQKACEVHSASEIASVIGLVTILLYLVGLVAQAASNGGANGAPLKVQHWCPLRWYCHLAVCVTAFVWAPVVFVALAWIYRAFKLVFGNKIYGRTMRILFKLLPKGW